ncbi:tail-anchored protein insertion receptor WRB-like isoform X1 [Pseudomyrmex gracilis]|uniref:tail-anchored protein insertion receptor WRB-like isoform X1 n=1 Tax=Pseudomyrmex gracilis TaxID=219809 RepID=UPI000994F39A|nr:tail-anchored protein insertion receptor WRB-like isoform X1 [Pseudomyrmex gracilis]
MNLLVTTTLSCVIDTILPFLVRYISTFFFTKLRYSYTADDIKMRDELKNMKKEMSHISVHDEFAKYARLQRKFNQVNNTFNEKIRNKLNRKAAYETILIRILSALNGIYMAYLLYMYRKQPIIILPEGALWPFQNYFSWPSEHENAISLLSWIVIARLGVSGFKELLLFNDLYHMSEIVA